MSLQIVLMKAGGTTPEIAAICLFLWSQSCSNTGVWGLLAHTEWWIKRSEVIWKPALDWGQGGTQCVGRNGNSYIAFLLLDMGKSRIPSHVLPDWCSPDPLMWVDCSVDQKRLNNILTLFSVWRFNATLSVISCLFLLKNTVRPGQILNKNTILFLWIS